MKYKVGDKVKINIENFQKRGSSKNEQLNSIVENNPDEEYQILKVAKKQPQYCLYSDKFDNIEGVWYFFEDELIPSDIEAQINYVVSGLLSAFENETKDKYNNAINSAVYVLKNIKNIKDPEVYSLFINFKIEEIQKIALKAIGITENTASILFLNYDFFSTHLSQFFEKYEGFTCSCDKSRWVLNRYLEYLNTGKIKPIPKEKKYWHPQKGETKDYIDFCESLEFLLYGKPENYFKCFNKLLNLYKSDNSDDKGRN